MAKKTFKQIRKESSAPSTTVGSVKGGMVGEPPGPMKRKKKKKKKKDEMDQIIRTESGDEL